MVSATESSKLFTAFSERAAKLETAFSDTSKDLDLARNLIQELQQMVNAHGAILPARDLQTYRSRLDGFKRRLDELKTPKKRFAFSRATKDTNAEEQAANKAQDLENKAESHLKAADATTTTSTATFVVENKRNDRVELVDVHGDVELRNIEASHIVIRGCPNALYVNEVHDSEVICDPVASSVLIVAFRNSHLQVACQQLRVHKAVGSKFRLHITSRSIIEDCRDLQFGPLPEDYTTNEQLWTRSGLNREKNNFTLVDDFNWLNTAQPSPNWKILD